MHVKIGKHKFLGVCSNEGGDGEGKIDYIFNWGSIATCVLLA